MPTFDVSKIPPEKARQIYLGRRKQVEDKYKGDPKKLRIALDAYEKYPGMDQLRKRAGLPAPAQVTVKTKKAKAPARPTPKKLVQTLRQEQSIIPLAARDIGASLLSSVNDATFGLPALLASKMTGLPNEYVQEFTDEMGRRAPYTNFLGTLVASAPVGMGAGSASTAGLRVFGTSLTKSTVPAVSRTGKVAQKLSKAATITRGQTKRNVARIATAGAGAGAATAAIKDRDIAEGTGYGAAGALAGTAGIKAGVWLGSKATGALRSNGVDTFLRKYTKTTKEQLQKRLDDFRKRGRAEPTIYELLDFEDRQALQKVFPRLTTAQQERGASMARERVQAIPSEVANVVRAETRGQRRANIEEMASALPASRGEAAPTMSEARLAIGAADNPTRLAQLRRDEARNIMAPFDDMVAVNSVKELIPTQLVAKNSRGKVTMVEKETDPEVARVISAIAGSAKVRDKEQGITVREITGMITDLKNAIPKASPIERGVLDKAVAHLEDTLVTKVPEVDTALARMNERYAARSRQLEGMQELRSQADVNPNTSRNLLRSENVFETPEGAVGRAMGQRSELINDLGQATSPSLGAVRELAESPAAARRISQNIGPRATENITEAARTQSESARRLASATRDPRFDAGEIESGDLALLAAALNPQSMAVTKARALEFIYKRLQAIPENRSRTIVDMLFSRDPAMADRAIRALRSEGQAGIAALGDIVGTLGGAVLASNAGSPEDAAIEPAAPIEEAAPVSAPDDLTQLSDEELMQLYEQEQAQENVDPSQLSDEELMQLYEQEQEAGVPYGRRVIEEVFPEAYITEDLRDPNSALGKANPSSHHNWTDGAVDLRPIPGMTFDEFIGELKARGYNIIEAKDETKNRSRHATGPHWHVVIG